MVVIQVSNDDSEKVFEILSSNGRFSGLTENRFSIIDNPEKVLENLTKEGIKYKVIE